MIWVQWRVVASDFDVDDFTSRHPELETDAVWRIGEKRLPSARAAETSGFSVSLAEGDSFEDVLSRTRQAVEGFLPLLNELRSLSVEAEVDFGLTVGGEKSFAPSVRFLPGDLAWFSDRGLGLYVSAYPCSSDDDEE